MSVGMCPLSNQLTPLPLNDDAAVYGGSVVLVSDSEVSAVSGMSDVATKERVVWLKMRRKKRHKSPFFSTKKIGENPNALSSISICSTPNQNNPTHLITDTFHVMGNTPAAAVI